MEARKSFELHSRLKRVSERGQLIRVTRCKGCESFRQATQKALNLMP